MQVPLTVLRERTRYGKDQTVELLFLLSIIINSEISFTTPNAALSKCINKTGQVDYIIL